MVIFHSYVSHYQRVIWRKAHVPWPNIEMLQQRDMPFLNFCHMFMPMIVGYTCTYTHLHHTYILQYMTHITYLTYLTNILCKWKHDRGQRWLTNHIVQLRKMNITNSMGIHVDPVDQVLLEQLLLLQTARVLAVVALVMNWVSELGGNLRKSFKVLRRWDYTRCTIWSHNEYK